MKTLTKTALTVAENHRREMEKLSVRYEAGEFEVLSVMAYHASEYNRIMGGV